MLAAFSAAERNHHCVEMSDIDYSLQSILDSKHANTKNTSVQTREVTQAEVEKNLGVKL